MHRGGRTVLHGGAIFTGDPTRPWAQAIAIDDGRIVAVGSDDEVLRHAAPRATRIALAGRVVIPGFNDAHVHIASPEGIALNAPDFLPGPGPTLDQIQALLVGGALATPPSHWLFAFIGSAVFDDPAVTRRALDAVSPEHPVALFAWTGHGIWLNTRALRVLGISETQPDPVGGFYRRYPGSNVITGETHEYAEYGVRRRLLSQLSDHRIVAQYRAFGAAAAQLGYTSLQEIPVGLTHQRALAAVRAAQMPQRVRVICFPLTLRERCEVHAGGHRDRVRGAGIKWITDGTPVERLSFVDTPYADRPDEVGLPNFEDDLLRDLLRTSGGAAPGFPRDPVHDSPGLRSHRIGQRSRHQLMFHSVGDAAIDGILDAIEDTGGARVWGHRRTRIEHGDLLFSWNRDRVRELGVVIVQNPTHFGLAPVFAERFVPEVFAELEPMRSLLADGIPLAIGSDGIAAPQSPFLNLFLAMIHPTRPSEALTIEQAVTAFTRGSAYAEFAEDHKGVLGVGYDADLIVLSQDIFRIPPPQIPATTVLLTMVDGRVVWDAGVLAQR